ncbi:MAG TPA: hypothetical protein DD611_00555 [Alphaproteobacteria bacterium]|nr:hypothetical protein [Alphaproteobacteria bacterium]HBS76902.1 hypothetical protein [Alphaproteobacteria bacterium]
MWVHIKTAKGNLAVGDFNKSYIGMTPPVFGLPLLYNRRIPDHNGGAYTINGANCAALLCGFDTCIARITNIRAC